MNLQMDENREMDRIAEYAKRIAYNLYLDGSDVAEWLTAWAIDWMSTDGIVFQIAATREFGATLSGYVASEAQKRGISLSADFSTEQAILREIQNGNGINHPVTLYRGTDHNEHNALESWTTSREIAEFYVSRNGGGQVIEETFQPEQILGTYQQGIGLECAMEVIVIH